MVDELGIRPYEGRSIELAYDWLAHAFRTAAESFSVAILLTPGSPWLVLKAKPVEPFEVGTLPDVVDLALWRETGAVHVVVDGAVQDPPIVPPVP